VRVPFAIPAGTSNVDFEEMEKLITIRTKMICLCNPLNPTEKYFLKMNLQLGKIACKHNLIILSDEIWSDIVFLPAVFTSIASINEEIRNQTITITGFSKLYGLAGLRIGAVIAHNHNHFKLLMDTSLHNSNVALLFYHKWPPSALNECGYYQIILSRISLRLEPLSWTN
jgi:aspartate/methionine/tyrosine aminotransferase